VPPRRPRHLKRDLMIPPSVPVDLTRRLETRMLIQSRSGGLDVIPPVAAESASEHRRVHGSSSASLRFYRRSVP
jgi:hypothetical protein